MEALKLFYFCLIFPGVMYLLSLMGCAGAGQLGKDPVSFAVDLTLNFTAAGLLSLIATYGLSIYLGVNPVQLYVFGAFNAIVIGFVNSSVDSFAVIGGQEPMAIGIFTLIKLVIVPAITLVASFQLLFGFGWEGFK